MIRGLAAALIGLLVVTGCGGRQQLHPRLDAEDEFDLATRAFDEKRYEEAAQGFKRLLFNHPESGLVDDARFYLGEAYLGQKEYELAIAEYKQLSRNHPRSPYADDADFSVGLAYYRQSPAFDLDQQFTERALEAFEVFLVRHPASELVPEAERLRQELREKLAHKEYDNGVLYHRLGRIESARIYFGLVQSRYGDTEWGIKAEKRLEEIEERYGPRESEAAAGSSEVVDVSGPHANAYTSRNNARSIAGDRAGTVHIVWQEAREEGDVVLYRQWNGTAWSEPERLSRGGQRCISPAIAAGAGGNLHVVWEREVGEEHRIEYRARREGAWAEAEQVATGSRAWYPAIAVAEDGTVHLLWMDDRSGNFEIWHRRRDRGGWSDPVQVSRTSGLSAMPSLAVERGGRVHAVWQEEDAGGGGGSVYYASSVGGSWTEAGELSSPGRAALHPCIAAEGGRTVLAVWQEGEGDISVIRSRALAEGEWGSPLSLSAEEGRASTPSVAGSGGRLVVAWTRDRNGEKDLVWRLGDGEGWGTPMAAAEGEHPTHPSVYLSSGGAVHIVWCDVSAGLWRVRYRREEPPR